MDHKNLEYFMKAQKLNRRQACWVYYLLRFDFTLKHMPGTRIEKVDEPSWRPDQKVGTKNNNSNQTLIKDYWIYNLVEVVIKKSKVNIVKKNKKSQK